MMAWLLRRLGQAAFATWLIASLVFLLSRLGTSAAEQAVFDQAEIMGSGLPVQTVASIARQQLAVRRRLGLDAPIFYTTRTPGPPVQWHWHGTHNQYHYWLSQLLHGNLGISQRDGQPVAAQLAPALACTLPLMSLALLAATSLALGLATYLAAGSPHTLGRWAVKAVLTATHALPLFALALLLLLLLANPDTLDLLPSTDTGALSTDSLATSAARLALPIFSLLLAALPELTLPLAAMLRHELDRPYAVAARAKGLPGRYLIWHHALPNALLPLLATFTNLLPTLVSGTVVVETLFALPGVGRLLAEAAAAHDYPVLVAGVLVAAAARLLAQLAADVAHYYLDPRLRAPSI